MHTNPHIKVVEFWYPDHYGSRLWDPMAHSGSRVWVPYGSGVWDPFSFFDQRVVELSKQYLPQLSCGFSDARVSVHYQDGAEFMMQHPNQFDIIITDSSDPIGMLGPTCIHKLMFTLCSFLSYSLWLICYIHTPCVH